MASVLSEMYLASQNRRSVSYTDKITLLNRQAPEQERQAEALRQGGLITYKDQMSYGVHIVVVMGVFYLMGHLASATISSKISVVMSLSLLAQNVTELFFLSYL